MPRLYREMPLASIWEGSGNVMALDVLRALSRSPEVLQAFLDEVDEAAGADARLDAFIARAARRSSPTPRRSSSRARRVVERMALALQGSLLVRHAPPAVADAFCAVAAGRRRRACSTARCRPASTRRRSSRATRRRPALTAGRSGAQAPPPRPRAQVDERHHPRVLVIEDVAVEDELPGEVRERHVDLDARGLVGRAGRQRDDVLDARQRRRPAAAPRTTRKSFWWMWNGCHSFVLVEQDPALGRAQRSASRRPRRRRTAGC